MSYALLPAGPNHVVGTVDDGHERSLTVTRRELE
jgi:hypothetical protein